VEHDEDSGRAHMIVTEIPYMVNKSRLLEEIAQLVKDKRIEGISDLRDESDKEGMRVVIELKKDAIEEVVLNQLFAHSQLQTTFSIINIALVNNQPRTLSLKEMLDYYIEHRFDVVKRRTEHRLREAEKRAHILAGLMIALDHLDEVIRLIRKAKTRDEARSSLMSKYLLSEEQTKAILEMQLQRLTGMEMQAVRDEADATKKLIEGFKSILKDEKKILGIIRSEALELKEQFGDPRRTTVVANAVDMDIEDLIPIEDVVVMISNTGYIKRLPLDTYESQHRGGLGLVGMETKEEDHVVDLFVTCSHDYIMYITNKGRVYWLKAYKIPVGGRHAKGKPIVNLLEHLEDGEKVVNTIPVKVFDEDSYLVFATKNGTIKKTRLSAYSHVRQSGIIAIRLDDGDEIIDTAMTDGAKEIILATRKGLAARFLETDVRPTGRATYGVRGVRLVKGDSVVSMAVVEPNDQLLTVCENGYGKRSPVEDYRKIRRGGKGVITIKTGERNGDVVCAMKVTDDEELIVTSVNGMVIRMPVKGISVLSRATMGVRLMKLKEKDKVTAVARLLAPSEEERAVQTGRSLAVSREPGKEPKGDGEDPGEPEDEDEEGDGEKEDENGEDG